MFKFKIKYKGHIWNAAGDYNVTFGFYFLRFLLIFFCLFMKERA